VRFVEPSTRAALAWRGADGDERLEVYDAVCWTVGSTVQCPPSWPFERCDRSGKIAVDSTLRAAGYDDVFAVGDVARIVSGSNAQPFSSSPRPGDAGFEEYSYAEKESFAAAPPSPPDLPSTAQVAFQQADYASWNVWAAVANKPALPFKYQHIGDMMTTGSFDAAVALPVGDATIDGVAGALLRRAAYLYRMPTDEHRVKLAGAWLVNAAEAVREKGAAGALEEYLGLEVPEELKTLEKMLPKPPGF
jgi:NADH:ubiquinone reductase (non-electrogenic)